LETSLFIHNTYECQQGAGREKFRHGLRFERWHA
jgi:hypothetical protein